MNNPNWKRKRKRRTKPYEKKKFQVFHERGPRTLECKKCHRFVEDNDIGRNAHNISCVRIQRDA